MCGLQDFSAPEDLENDDDSDGLPDRFASSGQQERQALTGQTNVVAPLLGNRMGNDSLGSGDPDLQ